MYVHKWEDYIGKKGKLVCIEFFKYIVKSLEKVWGGGKIKVKVIRTSSEVGYNTNNL
jgi:hypothetical protein